MILNLQATKSSLSENEKREKRAMERKISEMEEELKVSCVRRLAAKRLHISLLKEHYDKQNINFHKTTHEKLTQKFHDSTNDENTIQDTKEIQPKMPSF